MLYKYFSEERSSFFLRPMLRFSPIKDINDPFECRAAYKRVCSTKLLEAYIDHKKQEKDLPQKPRVLKKVYTAIINEFDLLWDSRNHSESEQKVREANLNLVDKYCKMKNEENRIDQVGILCLSGNNDNPTMWAHYASEHKGFAIGFDISHDFFQEVVEDYEEDVDENGKHSTHAKTYSRTKPQEIAYSEEWAADYIVGLEWFTATWSFMDKKSKSWKYEDERRVFQYSIDSYNHYGEKGLVDCPIGAISSIYLGLKPSSYLKALAVDFCRKNPLVTIEEAYLDSKAYKILFRECSLKDR